MLWWRQARAAVQGIGTTASNQQTKTILRDSHSGTQLAYRTTPVYYSKLLLIVVKSIEKIKNIVGQEKNLAQTAISFCLAYDAVSTVIPGNTSVQQLKNNIASISEPISKELLKKLEKFYQDEVVKCNLPW